MLLDINDGENPIVIARYSTKVDWDYGFRVFIDCTLDCIIIHFQRIRLGINKHEFRTNMAHY